jgi:AcrR family transcriptional regulator
MDATRSRILQAAIALYAERGISATTMREIGERADVAPGTLRNHFPSREALDEAMIEQLREEGPLPTEAIYDGAATTEERLRRILIAAGRFYLGAARLYRMWVREPMLTGPWRKAGTEYGERWGILMRLALGPSAEDADARAVLRAVLHPEFLGQLAADTRTIEEVADLVTAMLSAWLATRGP